MNEAHNIDCLEAMAQMKDNQFDLAIVDPPYGIGEDGGANRRGESKHVKKKWDTKQPNEEYFNELKRVSRNQIIWGANYFIDKIYMPSMGWICWDKKLDNSDFSDFELAFTTFEKAAKIFRYSKNGGSRTPAALSDIIHPTQKPIALYKWTLKNYAKPGDTIVDAHGGSMSLRIACYDMGYDCTTYEIDKDYFDAAELRYQNHIQQQSMFKPDEMY